MSSSSTGAWDPPSGGAGGRQTCSLIRFHAEEPAAQKHGANARTIAAPMGPTGPCDFRRLFLDLYPRARAMANSIHGIGLAVLAADRLSGELAASMALTARPGRVIGAIVGRHEAADLRLANDPWLANRQLALLLHPLGEDSDPRYTVLDLRTHHPMLGEDRVPLHSAMVQGPFFVQIGRYALFCLPIGPDARYPEDGVEAWQQLPARVVLHQQPAAMSVDTQMEARRIALQALDRARRADGRGSVITSIGPLMSPDERLVRPDEDAVAILGLETRGAQISYGVGSKALERGILLGRYPRCDGAGVLAHDRISRAHLLIKQIDDQVIALDTASMNGTELLEPRMLEGRVRVVPLGEAARLVLADRARVRWQMLARR